MNMENQNFTAIRQKDETNIDLQNNTRLRLISASNLSESSFDNSKLNRILIKN